MAQFAYFGAILQHLLLFQAKGPSFNTLFMLVLSNAMQVGIRLMTDFLIAAITDEVAL